jgi:predicted DNA-binding transcriptional regulator AlpA
MVAIPTSQDITPAILDVVAVSRLLDCSTRSVYRLSDARRIPRPVKLGALVRWPRTSPDKWLDEAAQEAESKAKRTNRRSAP